MTTKTIRDLNAIRAVMEGFIESSIGVLSDAKDALHKAITTMESDHYREAKEGMENAYRYCERVSGYVDELLEDLNEFIDNPDNFQ
jgi:phytoene/squalene synthetase